MNWEHAHYLMDFTLILFLSHVNGRRQQLLAPLIPPSLSLTLSSGAGALAWPGGSSAAATGIGGPQRGRGLAHAAGVRPRLGWAPRGGGAAALGERAAGVAAQRRCSSGAPTRRRRRRCCYGARRAAVLGAGGRGRAGLLRAPGRPRPRLARLPPLPLRERLQARRRAAHRQGLPGPGVPPGQLRADNGVV